MEDDAGALVRRLALKTRFSEMGWGSTPPSSAKVIESWMSGLNRHPAKVFSTKKWNVGSNPTLSANVKKQQLPKIVVDK